MVYVILCGFKNLEHQQVFENDEDKTFKYTKIAHLLDIFYKGRPVQFDISDTAYNITQVPQHLQ